MKISADCLEFSHLCPNIRTFVLVSCDADFLHVAQSLRRRGLNVVVVGKKDATLQRLTAGSDGVVFYNAEPQPAPVPIKLAATITTCNYKIATVDKALVSILKESEKEGKKGYPQTLAVLKTMLKSRLPHFDEKACGKSKFSDFVREREKSGVLKLVRVGNIDKAALPDAK